MARPAPLTGRHFAAALALGAVSAAGLWGGWTAVQLIHGRSIAGWPLLWNLPISSVFLVMTWQTLIAATVLRGAFVRRFRAILVAWGIGFALLALRLGAQAIDVSGHMTWAILLGTQSVVLRLPAWFTALIWLVALQVLLLKLTVLGGESGYKGLLAGGMLAALVVLGTPREDGGFFH